MHNICDLNTINWINPFNRFVWEGLCGYGGATLAAFLIVILIFAGIGSIAAKIKE